MSKACSPMVVTLLGITVSPLPLINLFFAVSIMPLQLSRESYTGLPCSTTMARFAMVDKALGMIEVTLAGMVIALRLVQEPKATSSIAVTVLGMLTPVKPEQPSKALSPIRLTVNPFTSEGMVILPW